MLYIIAAYYAAMAWHAAPCVGAGQLRLACASFSLPVEHRITGEFGFDSCYYFIMSVKIAVKSI
jgi:hypothetical protein